MISGSTSFHNISSTYSIKLNEEETLEFRKEKRFKSPEEEKKEELSKAQKELTSNKKNELSEGELQMVQELEARDAEVKAHEAAHQAAGGGLTGPASYTYQQGPDGKMYAIGGEVSIAMKSGSTPEETIKNARQIAAAAMAAGDPSPQDFAVASSARVMEIKAIQQLAKKQQEEALGKSAYGMNQNNSTSPNEQSNTQEPFDISA